MNEKALVSVRVCGEYALFTRPELHVERVSYPVMTPSAARGVLEAIFWKPEFRYQIREIGVLKMGSQTVVLRNEIERRQGDAPFFVEDVRQQRSSLLLKDVAYLIRAELALRPWANEPIYKYSDQFNRRVKQGQCHHTPYLGTREFAANFEPPREGEAPEPLNMDLGLMLLDIAHVEDPHQSELKFIRHGPQGPRQVAGYTKAFFFEARLEDGWLRVPQEKYLAIYRLEGEHV